MSVVPGDEVPPGLSVEQDGLIPCLETHDALANPAFSAAGMVVLPAAVYLVMADANGHGAFVHSGVTTDFLLVGGGPVTMVPLLLFAYAAPRVPLTTVGILQYINPTMQFLLGVLLYREPFTQDRLIGFGLVWAGLVLFWGEGLYARRNLYSEPVPELGEG